MFHKHLIPFMILGLAKCTTEQRQVVDKCFDFLAKTALVPKLMFIDSPAGGGKTFLLNLILCLLRGEGRIALACATTGIASMLLAGGTTAHSRFGVPVPVADESTSNIKVTSERARVIEEAAIIIWDEITMADKHVVECADRLCREIMALNDAELENVPFGGKVVIFSGDWRQLLPVVKHGGRAQVVNASLKRSTMWTQSSILFRSEI
jgi:ATP-dependent DNA helicase PIF1